MKLVPLALVPTADPPVFTVYQLILLPDEVAVRLEDAPLQSVEGEALTEVGTVGSADTPTFVVTVLEHPLPLV